MAGFAALSPSSGLPLSPLLLTRICTAAALLFGIAAAWHWQRSRRSSRPQLKLVGMVAALFIYPVKSCRGVAVKRAEMTSLGLRDEKLRDRFWTVIKKDGQMISAKNIPRMILISVSCEDDYLILNAPGMKTLQIPLELPQTNSIWNCRRFGLQTQGKDCGDEAAEWITTFLNREHYRYRKCDPSEEHDYKSNPPFGWLYGVEETGILEVGDPVYKIIS